MTNEDIKIGVFVCHCGTNIGGVLDVPSLADYARTLPNVTYSADNLYTCSEVGLTEIKENIQEHDLNRVIVASCSPRTHEPLLRSGFLGSHERTRKRNGKSEGSYKNERS